MIVKEGRGHLDPLAPETLRKMEKIKGWSELPYELLSRIAGDLELIELLSFRGVCKDWNSASFTASAERECLNGKPWFLLYGESSECSLVSNKGEKYCINLPELKGATCLASSGGWLLVFSEGSLFFFCPFTRAKIELPEFPCPLLEPSDYIGAFSYAPTSENCTAALISRKNDLELELHVICRGDKEWTKHNYRCPESVMKTISCCVYYEERFYFLNTSNVLITFHEKTKRWKRHTIPLSLSKIKKERKLYVRRNEYFSSSKEELKAILGLGANVSIQTCGTAVPYQQNFGLLIQGEKIEAAKGTEGPHLKGVWFEARFFQILPEQSW